MRNFLVNLPAREGKPERKIVVSFTHPWKNTSKFGFTRTQKVTTCSIGEELSARTKEDKPKYRFYSFSEVKWPLQAPSLNGKVEKSHSFVSYRKVSSDVFALLKAARNLLPIGVTLNFSPAPVLSKKDASKYALRKTLGLCRDVLNADDRKLIWDAFHKEFKTGVIVFPPVAPDTTSPVVSVDTSRVSVMPVPPAVMNLTPSFWQNGNPRLTH